MSKEKILTAAKEEFAKFGFSGARVNRIAEKAGINKAMLFYYFSSKENLYKSVLRQTILGLMSQIKKFLKPNLKASEFFEKMPEIYINYFLQNKDFIKIMGRELINDGQYYKIIIKETLEEDKRLTPSGIKELINKWIKNGEIKEESQFNMMMNIVSLSLFSFIGKPIAENILDINIKEDEKFYKNRIKSISNLLKRGMLK
jgi:AcrR family transcriptional regulator